MRKAAFLTALALALCLLLSACGSKSAAEPEMSEVVAAVEAVVPTDGMTELTGSYLENVFKLTEEQYEDCYVMSTNVGTTIDEFGIFKAADEAQAAELKSAVEAYLQFRLDSWMPEPHWFVMSLSFMRHLSSIRMEPCSQHLMAPPLLSE